MNNENILKKVNSLVAKYGSTNPFYLAKCLNIEIYYDDIGSLLGMYTVIKRNRFIVLNEELDEETAKTVCAHELGHDRLHRDILCGEGIYELSLYDLTTRPEYEANLFAAHLLIDESDVREQLQYGYNIDELAASLYVDKNLLIIKLNECLKFEEGINLPELPRGNFLKKYNIG